MSCRTIRQGLVTFPKSMTINSDRKSEKSSTDQEDISLCHASADNSRLREHVPRLLTENFEPKDFSIKEQDKTPKIELKTHRPTLIRDTPCSNGSISGSKLLVENWGSAV
jgi:hypothetical protein